MSSSKYFNLYNRKSEQNLIESLIIETIKIHGIDAVYIPRQTQKLDLIFNEDVLSKFTENYDIEVYLKSTDGFGGEQDIFKKFGLEVKDQITFTVSRSRFEEELADELNNPREGDLIYISLGPKNMLFEIKYVKEDSVFYNAGELFVYELQCELYTFAQEQISTGEEDIDEEADKHEFLVAMSFVSGSGLFPFQDGEKIFQGTDSNHVTATANIATIEDDNNITVKDIEGQFIVGSPINGYTSEVTRTLATFNDMNNLNDTQEDNELIQTLSDQLIDFSESNPFSEEDE